MALIQEVVVPLATRTLKEVDSARRAMALRRFLTNEQNRKSLRESIDQLADLIKQSETERRRLKVKEYVDALNDFGKTMIATKATTDVIVERCEDWLYNNAQSYRRQSRRAKNPRVSEMLRCNMDCLGTHVDESVKYRGCV